MPRQESRDPTMIKPNPYQTRPSHDPEAFRQLVESIRQQGILQPPGILPDNTNVWGWSRVLAAIEAGLKEIPVLVLPADAGRGHPILLTLTENLVRSSLTQQEELLGFEEALRLNPGMTQKSLAQSLGVKEAMLSRYLTVGKNPLVRDPFLAKTLNLSVAYQIASSAAESQQGLLNMALQGPVTRESIATAVRQRASRPDSAKLSRVICQLPEVKVTVQGKDLDLTGLIEVLQTTLEAARKANKELWDIRTFEKVLKDKAKAG